MRPYTLDYYISYVCLTNFASTFYVTLKDLLSMGILRI